MRKILIAALFGLISTVARAETAPADGQVTKIDSAQSKITLKHGPIKNLDMDSMTMVFLVADAGMLTKVKVGDKVSFEADRVDGRLTVVKIQKTK